MKNVKEIKLASTETDIDKVSIAEKNIKTKTVGRTERKEILNPSVFEDILESIKSRKEVDEELMKKYAYYTGRLFGGGFILEGENEVVRRLFHSSNDFMDEIKVKSSFIAGKRKPIDEKYLSAKSNVSKILVSLNIHNLKEGQHFRVGNEYYENILRPSIYDNTEPALALRTLRTITMDYGRDYPFTIKKYDGFCYEPNYVEYHEEVSKHKNLFQPFRHEAKEGDFPHIEKLFEHTFSDQTEIGYDYVHLLYEKPKQMLPILCLVSQKQGTGKTTFINWLSVLFKGNTAILSTSDIEGSFNAHYCSKHLLMVDESDLHKEKTTSKIKQMATQKTIIRKEKFVTDVEITFFGKLILLSNNESTFINIKDEDTRYWIRKLNPITEFNPEFDEKLINEIPAFVYFIQNRELFYTSKQSRLWFPTEAMESEYLRRSKTDNKSELYMEMLPSLIGWFIDRKDVNEIEVTPLLLKYKMFNASPKDYTNKHIAHCLRTDFGYSPSEKTKRFKNPFYNKRYSWGSIYDSQWCTGTTYIIKRTDVLKDYVEL